jgi:2,4-dienoyl-CoA reductase-like NADH-dependent reductase (Old Yellow Enzyme family)
MTTTQMPRGYGFQVGYAERIRRDAKMLTSAVGLIVDPHQAEAIVADGHADLVTLAREALNDPNWTLHAQAVLDPAAAETFSAWPCQSGWYLARRAPMLKQLGPYPLDRHRT